MDVDCCFVFFGFVCFFFTNIYSQEYLAVNPLLSSFWCWSSRSTTAQVGEPLLCKTKRNIGVAIARFDSKMIIIASLGASPRTNGWEDTDQSAIAFSFLFAFRPDSQSLASLSRIDFWIYFGLNYQFWIFALSLPVTFLCYFLDKYDHGRRFSASSFAFLYRASSHGPLLRRQLSGEDRSSI